VWLDEVSSKDAEMRVEADELNASYTIFITKTHYWFEERLLEAGARLIWEASGHPPPPDDRNLES
jgi:hypothetical protein